MDAIHANEKKSLHELFPSDTTDKSAPRPNVAAEKLYMVDGGVASVSRRGSNGSVLSNNVTSLSTVTVPILVSIFLRPHAGK